MDDPSAYLRALAGRIAAPYLGHAGLKSALLTGSSAAGHADRYSDIDLILYYDELPDEETLLAARATNHGGERIWQIGERAGGWIAEAYEVRGVQCQVACTTLAAWEDNMASVLERLDVASPQQKALAGVQYGIPLAGAALIQGWKDRLADYPPELGRAMVRHHLRFFPLWAMPDYLAGRDALVWRYQATVEAAQNIIGILAGLNGAYHSAFQFKRMGAFLDKLAIAPPELAARIARLFEPDLAAAGAELERLVDETLALVEARMPEIDTAAARQRIGWRQRPWDITDLILNPA
ncbi:MAG TPA: nucleotidyltransferase domain-containing protein [Herpetosiphonaceae bacterium]